VKYRRRKDSKPIPVLLDQALLERITKVSERLGEAKSTVMRIAMRLGLEGLEQALASSAGLAAVRYGTNPEQFMTAEERVEARAQEIEQMERERIIRARGKPSSSAKPGAPGIAVPTDAPIAAPPSPLTPREDTVTYRRKRKSSARKS
jgi:hypothetical protein